jgi:hypothetical protein
MRVGLVPLAERIAEAALEAARAKKGPEAARRRVAAAVAPILSEAVFIGLDQALIAVRGDPDAVLAISARKMELEA